MKFSVAAVMCVATLVVSVSAASDKKDGRKKLPTKTNRHNKAAAAASVEDKVLAEDEGYWERFLQNQEESITPPPTPPPTPGPTDFPTNPPGFCDTRVRNRKYSIYA